MSTLNCPGCNRPFFLGDPYCENCYYDLTAISKAAGVPPIESVSTTQATVDPFAAFATQAPTVSEQPNADAPNVYADPGPLVGPPQATSHSPPINVDPPKVSAPAPLPVVEPAKLPNPEPSTPAGVAGDLVCPVCNLNFQSGSACTNCGGVLNFPCPFPNCIDKRTGKQSLNPVGAKFCRTGGKQHPLAGPAQIQPPRPVAPNPVSPTPTQPVATSTGVYLIILDRSGQELQRFRLKPGANHVGASSPGENIYPDVDLLTLDPELWISRRHAVINVDATEITLTSVTATNFTQMDGQDLKANVPMRVSESSMIRFCHLTAKILRT